MRYQLLDEVRGLALISMVVFHVCYDLAVLYGVDIPWYLGTFGTLWQYTIAWAFVAVAGSAAALSHSNLKRACKLACVAALVTFVTVLVQIDLPIYFGVLHCLAVCTFVLFFGARWFERLPVGPSVLVCALCALFSLHVSDGYLWFGPLGTVSLPEGLYRWNALAFFGFPSPSYASGDYFPLLPYLFVYLMGYFAFRWTMARPNLQRRAAQSLCPPLAAVGRHTLSVYLVHQGVILAVLWLFLGAPGAL